MTYSPNYFLEALRMLVTISGWWILFYLRHRPAAKLRRIVLLVSFPLCYIVFMVIPLGNTGNEILWVSILLLFALLCGNLRESLFTAIYYIGIEACMDTIRNFIVRYSTGRNFPGYSTPYYLHFLLLYLVVLGWALFYYWVLKDRRGKLPLRFWIITVMPPLGSAALLTRFANMAGPLLSRGINIYHEGILVGLFLLILNLFTFFMYVRIISYQESLQQAKVLQGQFNANLRRITAIESFQRQAGEMRDEFRTLLSTLNIDMEQQNYEQVKKQVRELLGKRAEKESYTGISLIDAVISYKAALIREQGAHLGVQADLLDLTSPAAAPLVYDIASIMAIALDNVVDACEALRERMDAQGGPSQGGPSPVNCKILVQKNMLLIKVTNPLPKPLQYQNGEIQSSKNEGGYGLGLPTLHWIVRKYAGDLTITDSDTVFCLSVMLFV
jgi:ABC-type multidrug transport system fused ATPase/permease subunit